MTIKDVAKKNCICLLLHVHVNFYMLLTSMMFMKCLYGISISLPCPAFHCNTNEPGEKYNRSVPKEMYLPYFVCVLYYILYRIVLYYIVDPAFCPARDMKYVKQKIQSVQFWI